MGILVAGWSGLVMNRLGLTGLISGLVVLKNHHDLAHATAMLKDATTVTRAGMRSYLNATVAARLTDRLGEIKAPALLICGERDGKARSLQPKLQTGLRYPELILVPQGDHHIPTTMPGRLARMIEAFAHRVYQPGLNQLPLTYRLPVPPSVPDGMHDQPDA